MTTGTPVGFEITSSLPTPVHVGSGYGGESDWLHGSWKAGMFIERRTCDMTDPAANARSGFCVIDHVAHEALGRHDPSEFGNWIGVAP